MVGSLKKSKVVGYRHFDHGNRNGRSGGTFENNGSAATTTIRRQCRSGVMSEWEAVPLGVIRATVDHMVILSVIQHTVGHTIIMS
jgi:hypothetical protein